MFDEKKCPFCAETIKKDARKCRYCGSQLPIQKAAGNPHTSPSKPTDHPAPVGRTLSVVIVLILAFLCFTNPSKTEFVQFASEHISSKISEKVDSDNAIVNNLISGFTSLLVDGLIEHRNYLFFSTYSLDLNLLRSFGGNINDVRYLGIAGQFIPLSIPDFNKVVPASNANNNIQPSKTESMQDATPNLNCSKNAVCEREEEINFEDEKK